MLNISFEQQWPDGLGQSSGTQESFRSTMQDALGGVLRPAVDEVSGVTPYASIAGGWFLRETGSDIGLGIGNSVPHWIFREKDTVPHWPPFGPGSELAAWADAHGIEPYLVARAIARRGTRGNYNLTHIWGRTQSEIPKAVQGALYAWVLTSMTGQGR